MIWAKWSKNATWHLAKIFFNLYPNCHVDILECGGTSEDNDSHRTIFHKMLECMKLQSVAAMTGIEFPSLQCLIKIFTFCWDRILVVHSLFKTCISYSASSSCSSTYADSKMASYNQKQKFFVFEHFWTLFGHCCTFKQRKYLKIINYRAPLNSYECKRQSWSDNFWFYVL